jgi:hypothetical protein
VPVPVPVPEKIPVQSSPPQAGLLRPKRFRGVLVRRPPSRQIARRKHRDHQRDAPREGYPRQSDNGTARERRRPPGALRSLLSNERVAGFTTFDAALFFELD